MQGKRNGSSKEAGPSASNGGRRTFSTALGEVSVAWTSRGVSQVELPRRAPRRRHRPVGHGPAPAAVQKLIDQLKAYFDGRRVRPAATLDLAGATPFQRAVYREAQAIPRGSILTYGEIAEAIGRPRAARAVGQALGRNPVPVLIPCHRVVAATGGLGGFSAVGGVSLKKRMLTMEGVGSPGAGGPRNAMPFLEALLSRPERSGPMGRKGVHKSGVGGRQRRRSS